MKSSNLYTVKVKRGGRVTIDAPAAIYQTKAKAGDTAGTGSSLELRVYKALLALGWKQDQIDVQVDLKGGRSMKGGQVIDFVLYDGGVKIPIRVQGEWWHRDGGQEMWEASQINNSYGRMPVDIWGKDAATDEQAKTTILKLIGRPG